MTSAITNIDNVVSSEIVTFAIPKKNLIAYLDMLQDSLITEQLEDLGATLAAAKVKGGDIRESNYKGMYDRASHDIKRLCLEDALRPIINVSKIHGNMLNEINKNINNIFNKEVFSIGNTKVNHIIIYSLLTDISVFNRYAEFLSRTIMNSLTNNESQPKYIDMWMAKHSSRAIGIINHIGMRPDSTLVQAIKSMKISATDKNVVNEFNEVIVNDQDFATAAPGVKGFNVVLLPITFFRWIGEGIVNLKNKYYGIYKSRKDYMEARVNLLKMKLEGMDITSVEYQKLLDIIKKYEDIISKDDQKLKEYYDED